MPSGEFVDNHVKEGVKLEYVSIGCNRTPHALDWGQNGLIAFGACNSVGIYDPQPTESAGQVLFLLNKHIGKVNCVQWNVNKDSSKIELISGSTDKSICIWKQYGSKWMLEQQLNGHKDAIHALASITYDDGEKCQDISILASSAADSTVVIWKRNNGRASYDALQTLSFGNGFTLSIAITLLPKSNRPLIACGCDDTKIHLYSMDGEKFSFAESLQGHEDWIQTIDFSCPVGDGIFIASGSKDSYVRIWKISLKKDIEIKSDSLALEEQKFSIEESEYSIVLESVLSGHDGWVNGVRWKKSVLKEEKVFQPMVILSASMDKTMITWEFHEESGVWMDTARMGDVGGNSLGFYGCAFSPCGNAVLSHGFQGAFHFWKFSDNQIWVPEVTVSGHFGSVEDFEWDPLNSDFIISVSTDQTARLHAPWRRENKKVTWHEIARPQIHGYDMKCIACVNRGTYVSGAEEKVIRVFAAPGSFFDSLSQISQITSDNKVLDQLPLGASMPALGLSNKAVFQSDLDSWKGDTSGKNQPMKASAFASEDPAPFTPIAISRPPPEEILLQNTLWPETYKLYGHGFEIFCMACDVQGTIIASACKASKSEFANILLWDTRTWKQIGNLMAHSLTVTQLAFSHSGNMLLSVSRDRTWALYKRNIGKGMPFSLLQKTDKTTCLHTRIIWSCCWTFDDRYFFTASRDKKIMVWGQVDTNEFTWKQASQFLDVGEAATAVDALPYKANDERYVIAVGRESGLISLHSWCSASCEWRHIINVDKMLCPTMTVKRIRWNKHSIPSDQHSEHAKFTFYLAACSSDTSLRIISVPFQFLVD